jgi:nucleotide-binding universal stress UspA family protein
MALSAGRSGVDNGVRYEQAKIITEKTINVNIIAVNINTVNINTVNINVEVANMTSSVPGHLERSTVVVGVDRSAGSRTAAQWALEFSRAMDCDLHVVGAWSYPAVAALPGGPALRSPEEMDEDTFETVRSVMSELTGRPVEEIGATDDLVIEVDRGPADRAILSRVDRRTRVVVVGKRGLGALEGRLLGSVSRRVAELSPAPVAVVPSEPEISMGAALAGPIVVGVDASEAATAARDWAIQVARHEGSELVVVHGLAGLPAELPPSAIDRFVERATSMTAQHVEVAREAGLEARVVVEVMDPRMLLRSVADQCDAAMIVVGSTGEGPTAGLLVGSVVGYVAQQSERPVVVVNSSS